MTTKTSKWISVTLDRAIFERLKKLAAPGQSPSGILQELVEERERKAVDKMYFPNVEAT